ARAVRAATGPSTSLESSRGSSPLDCDSAVRARGEAASTPPSGAARVAARDSAAAMPLRRASASGGVTSVTLGVGRESPARALIGKSLRGRGIPRVALRLLDPAGPRESIFTRFALARILLGQRETPTVWCDSDDARGPGSFRSRQPSSCWALAPR